MAKDGRLYAKFTLDFPDSHKILPLSDKAFRALVEMTIWSRKQMTDGFVASRLAVAKWSLDVLQELCSNDPENPSLIEVENGYQIHDFAEHQDTRAEIEARSARNKAAGQKGGQARAKRSAKRGASESLSETQAETETETETTSGYVGDDPYVSNPRERAHDPAPPEPADTATEVVVIDPAEVPAHIDNPARPAKRRPSSAARWLVRNTLGGDYPNSTIDQLAVQVDKLLAEGKPEDRIRDAIAEWQRRPDRPKPSWLGSIYGDLVQQARAAPAMSTSDQRFAAAQALKTPEPHTRKELT